MNAATTNSLPPFVPPPPSGILTADSPARRTPIMPTITVNAEPRSFPDPLTVADLLRHLDKDPKKLAVEVNRDLVPRPEHMARRLRDGDAVEIVTLVGGGSGQETGGRRQETEKTKTG